MKIVLRVCLMQAVLILLWGLTIGWSWNMIVFFGIAPTVWLLTPAQCPKRNPPRLYLVPQPSPDPPRRDAEATMQADAETLMAQDCPGCSRVAFCDNGFYRFCRVCGRDIWGDPL